MAEGFGQYLEQVGPNRIKPVKQEIQDLAFGCLKIATDLWPEAVGAFRNHRGV